MSNEKTTKLKMQINTPSGFSSKEQVNISLDQWNSIQAILHNDESKSVSKPWCKIYEIGDYQVLVKKETFDEEEQKYVVSVSSWAEGSNGIDGLEISMQLRHPEESELDKMFEKCNEEVAKNFLQQYVIPVETGRF